MGTNGGGGGIGSVFFNRLKKTFASTTKKPIRGGGSYGGVHFDDDPPMISIVANTTLGRWLSPEGKHGRGAGSSDSTGNNKAVTNQHHRLERADSSVCDTPSVRLDIITQQQQQQQQQQPGYTDNDQFMDESNTQNNMVLTQSSVLFPFPHTIYHFVKCTFILSLHVI